jgi:hypothetical protein
MGEDPIKGEIEEIPQPTDSFIRVSNVRKLDGKEIPNLAMGVDSVIYPWHRITFVELMAGEKDLGEVVGFFRT